MRTPSRLRTITFIVALALAVQGAWSPAPAVTGEWTIRFEPMYMDSSGHDQHVLTIHDGGRTEVDLDTEGGFAYRTEIQCNRKEWGFGIDIFAFLTSQFTDPVTAAGAAGDIVFEVPGRSYTSTSPSEILYYEVLEDTDVQLWTADLYATKSLTERPTKGVDLQFGLRVGDFDNDYHSIVGIQGVEGSHLDASSNYDLMMGPLVAIASYHERGKHTFKGYLGQSVIVGDVELSKSTRDFVGPFSDTPAYTSTEEFRKIESATIPITELRVSWTYQASEIIALGLGLNTSTWWGVPVPPGVVVEGGIDGQDESTIFFYGLAAVLELTF